MTTKSQNPEPLPPAATADPARSATVRRPIIGRVRLRLARFHFEAERRREKLVDRLARGSGALVAVAVLVALAASSGLAWWANFEIIGYFKVDKRWETLSQLFISAGGALIGATAIAFSIITFAMQVNVERMPHALFNRLSADWRLLGYAVTSFGAACGVALLSLVPDVTWSAVVLVAGAWLTLAVFSLYMLAYRRAIALVSPIQQLSRLVQRIHKALGRWRTLADTATKAMPDDDSDDSGVDQRRLLFLNVNSSWTQEVKQGIEHAIAYSRRYGEQGDYEVAEQALNALVVINALYVQAKGRTFFSYAWMVENPLVDDPVITRTLESLRQRAKTALMASDERQMELTLRGFEQLFRVYERIEYQKHSQSKTHAMLATHYLVGAVQDVVRQGFPDVSMEGTRLLGQIGIALAEESPTQATTVTNAVSLVGCIAARRDLVVSMTAARQLAAIELAVLKGGGNDVRFALQECRSSIRTLALAVLQTPDEGFASGHGAWLAPYFGATDSVSFIHSFVNLANALGDIEDDTRRERICGHIAEWADRQSDFTRTLFEPAVTMGSSLTFHLLHWIEMIPQALLLAASHASARRKAELENHALWLVSVLSWAPTDKNAAHRLESNNFGDLCFRVAQGAASFDATEVCERAQAIIIRWAMEVGQEANGWGSLERGMLAAAAIQLCCELGDSRAMAAKVETARLKAKNLNPEQMFREAENLREEADTYRDGYSHSYAERALARSDPARVREMLHAIADILDPTRWLVTHSSPPPSPEPA